MLQGNTKALFRKSVVLYSRNHQKSVFLFGYFIGKVYFCSANFKGKV